MKTVIIEKPIENPRKRRRRRKRGTTRRSSRRKARRNPALATLANPRRRSSRRRSHSSYYPRRHNPRRSYGRGGLLAGIDVQTAAWVGGGMIGIRVVPGLLSKVWKNAPTTGLGAYAIKVGGVVALGFATRMLTRSQIRTNQVMAGALGLILFDMFNEYVAPKLGLYGLGGFVYDYPKLSGINGFVPAATVSSDNFVNRRNAGRVPVYMMGTNN